MAEDTRVERITEWLNDHTDEAAYIANCLGFEWAQKYDLDDLCRDCFNEQLDDFVSAFQYNGCDASYSTDYCYVAGDVITWDSLEYTAEEYTEEIAERLVEYYDDEILDKYYNAGSRLEEILMDNGSFEWQDVQDAYSEKEAELMRWCILEANTLSTDATARFLVLGKRANNAWEIVEALDKTHFFGIPEDRYAELFEYIDAMTIVDILDVIDKVEETAKNGISVRKAVEILAKEKFNI